MPTIYPTTLAIIAGLRGETFAGGPIHRGLAEMVRQLVVETKLPGTEDIVDAGLAGWDLGYRQDGSRCEITARHRDDRQFEILVTALLDKKSGNGWSFAWFVQGDHPTKSFPKELYPNGTARSFKDAVAFARERILRKESEI